MSDDLCVKDIGEFELIHRIQSILGTPQDSSKSGVLVGLGDDAAVITSLSSPSVITTDAMVEDVHFRNAWTSGADLATKALASNYSDLAAKCAKPLYNLVTFGLTGDTSVSWVEEFYRTLVDLQHHWGGCVIGGDTVKSEKRFVSITAIGQQLTANPVCINTAQPGDAILVTGTLGDSATGLEVLEERLLSDASDSVAWLIDRCKCPTPRLDEAAYLSQNRIPSSMTDISDGLARDLLKLCRASDVGALVHAEDLPVSHELQQVVDDPVAYAWRGGEDYELLLTLPQLEAEQLLHEWPNDLCDLTLIGEIVPRSAILKEGGIELTGWDGALDSGFDHFLA